MATEDGEQAIVHVGGSEIVEGRSYTYTATRATEDTPIFGNAARVEGGRLTATITLETYATAGTANDALGAALDANTPVALILRRDGTGVGKPEKAGDATVTGETEGVNADGKNVVTWSLVADEQFTRATQ